MTITVLAIVPRIVYIEPQHHRVVLVNRVVAVHRVAPHKIAEAEINSHIIVFTEPYDILSASFDQRRRIAVARENLVLLKVDVDRMGPIESAFELPNLRGVALDSEADIVTVK